MQRMTNRTGRRYTYTAVMVAVACCAMLHDGRTAEPEPADAAGSTLFIVSDVPPAAEGVEFESRVAPAQFFDDDAAERADALLANFAQPAAGAPGAPSPGAAPNTPRSRSQLVQAPNRTAPRNPSQTGQHRVFSLSSVPNMIGDTTAGGCGQLQIAGITAASISHPTFACSRLNIAENNSPAVANRAYVTWRHFENATAIDVYGRTPLGGASRASIDRVIFGLEKRIGERNSFEARLPINTQLNSDLYFEQLTGPRVSIPTQDTTTEFGNISFIFKHQFVDRDQFYLSGGLGLNCPTAPDVNFRVHVDDRNFILYDLRQNPPVAVGQADVRADVTASVHNQTYNLSPFLASIWTPRRDWFMQSFLQFDLPLNRAQGDFQEAFRIQRGPAVIARTITQQGMLPQQKLLRANVGGGHWWWNDDRRRLFKSLGTMLELHYTTTIEDATLLGPFQVAPDLGTGGPTTLTVGNLNNRIDILNFVVGVPMRVGRTTITNAYIIPVKKSGGFDYEYTLILNRAF
jgi:hypothetical protein